MSTAAVLRAGVASDPGLQRSINEDRVLADELHGVFLVVDGLGGHAAGDIAAETAVRAIERHVEDFDRTGDLESTIRAAIADANNWIFELAEQNPEYRGMACVLTLAVVRDDHVVVGHVGDSRLYLIWNGNIRKLTPDHSPVGEQEDSRELSETEAMHHPRRNEVFRDVGSAPHDACDPEFVEVRSFRFRSDAALLLCSDGLSDLVPSAHINAIVEAYEGDPNDIAQELVNAANKAGGKDNVSVIFIPGPEFYGVDSMTSGDARARHAITRMRPDRPYWWPDSKNLFWLLIGIVLGMLLWQLRERTIM